VRLTEAIESFRAAVEEVFPGMRASKALRGFVFALPEQLMIHRLTLSSMPRKWSSAVFAEAVPAWLPINGISGVRVRLGVWSGARENLGSELDDLRIVLDSTGRAFFDAHANPESSARTLLRSVGLEPSFDGEVDMPPLAPRTAETLGTMLLFLGRFRGGRRVLSDAAARIEYEIKHECPSLVLLEERFQQLLRIEDERLHDELLARAKYQLETLQA
jgi:hypothetical protein